jgi:hypothetical protein
MPNAGATSHCGSGNNSANRYDLYLSPWWRYSGCGLDIAVGGSAAWLVGCGDTSGGYVIRRLDSVATCDWKSVSGGGLRIAVGPDGIPWLVNRDGNIYRGEPDGSDWHSIDGCAHDIAVGGDGSVWVVGCSHTPSRPEPIRHVYDILKGEQSHRWRLLLTETGLERDIMGPGKLARDCSRSDAALLRLGEGVLPLLGEGSGLTGKA